MRINACNPDHDRLLATRFYEERSPLEMVRDVELGQRTSEMLDCLEDEDDVTFWGVRAGHDVEGWDA